MSVGGWGGGEVAKQHKSLFQWTEKKIHNIETVIKCITLLSHDKSFVII